MKSSKVVLHVQAQDIKRAVQMDGVRCPIARALNRQFKAKEKGYRFRVDYTNIVKETKYGREIGRTSLPLGLSSFIRSFDAGGAKSVEPGKIEFEGVNRKWFKEKDYKDARSD